MNDRTSAIEKYTNMGINPYETRQGYRYFCPVWQMKLLNVSEQESLHNFLQINVSLTTVCGWLATDGDGNCNYVNLYT